MDIKYYLFLNCIFIHSFVNSQIAEYSLKYQMDSVYNALEDLVDNDSTIDTWSTTLITLNKGKLINSKGDTAFKYIKLAYDLYPHESYYNDFEEEKETTKYINKVYPKIFPNSYKYMLNKKDSVEKVYDTNLQKILIKLYSKDQKDRIDYEKLLARKDLDQKVLQKASVILDQNDSKRINTIDSIIKVFGYPGKSLVGFKYSHYALIIIQHSQSKNLFNYFDILKNAFYRGEISKADFALYIDRLLIGTNRRQLFGTQYNINKGELSIFPIGKPEQLDKRRKNFGFISFSDEIKNLKREMDTTTKSK